MDKLKELLEGIDASFASEEFVDKVKLVIEADVEARMAEKEAEMQELASVMEGELLKKLDDYVKLVSEEQIEKLEESLMLESKQLEVDVKLKALQNLSESLGLAPKADVIVEAEAEEDKEEEEKVEEAKSADKIDEALAVIAFLEATKYLSEEDTEKAREMVLALGEKSLEELKKDINAIVESLKAVQAPVAEECVSDKEEDESEEKVEEAKPETDSEEDEKVEEAETEAEAEDEESETEEEELEESTKEETPVVESVKVKPSRLVPTFAW